MQQQANAAQHGDRIALFFFPSSAPSASSLLFVFFFVFVSPSLARGLRQRRDGKNKKKREGKSNFPLLSSAAPSAAVDSAPDTSVKSERRLPLPPSFSLLCSGLERPDSIALDGASRWQRS